MAGTPPQNEDNEHHSDRRQRIIDAFMNLLAEGPIEQIGFDDVTRRAGISLADCRGEFGSLMSILAAYVKQIDRQVLTDLDPDLAGEPVRERLFDVLMRRLEALAPRKPAIRSLMRSARRNPGLAVALNGLSLRSQQWMLTAAGIRMGGPGRTLRTQGLALLYASVLRTWLDDDDPGQARTMAALDRELARGARYATLLDDACRIAALFRRPWTRSPRPRRPEAGSDDEPVAV